MAADPPARGTPAAAPGDDAALEDIVAEFILEREEGGNPSVDDYLTRHPRHAEALARLLTCETHPPARRPSSRGDAGKGAGPGPATRLGPYEVIEHVSTAGGGTVFRARHVEAGHVVALKVLDTRGAVDPRDVERFRREAAMLRALDLVHVVPVLDVGEEGGRFWIAMKWLDGETLARLRDAAQGKGHPLRDQRERARLIARVARTFAAIHGYGILHRDVKPGNIMIDRTGEPMIIDFGIAHAPDLPELTATTDQLMGTPRYLAPELLAGGNRVVDERTDVYGLGLCLYELCTGAEAFRQDLRADLFSAIRTTGPAHPRDRNPGIPRDLAAVILRAIEIDPARRYRGMAAFADDLERCARGEPPELATLRGAHPLPRWVRRHRRRIVTAAALAAALVPAIVIAARRVADRVDAAAAERVIAGFAWFAPEAFAGDVGGARVAAATALASNPAATPEQRLMAGWIHFLAGDLSGALVAVGTADVATDGFAARLFRDHVKDLGDARHARGRGGHVASGVLDPDTSQPAINPRTGAEYEALVPVDGAAGVIVRDAARFDAAASRIAGAVPPRTPLDHLVAATLSWSVVSTDPRVDTRPRRAAIEQVLASCVEAAATRAPATHLRGVLRFLAGDFAAARRDLEAAASAQPAAIGSRYLLGIAVARSGDPALGATMLAAVARELPPSHAASGSLLGHLAVALSDAGRAEEAVLACERWWTRESTRRTWQDAVIPRVIAAHVRRKHGNLAAARGLLASAVDAEERIRLEEQEEAERGSGDRPGPIMLWEPALQELCAVASALGDDETADEYRAKMTSVIPMPKPPTAEAYLDLDLAGLRAPDAARPLFKAALPRTQ
jgi:hypothetical protein